MKTVLPEPVQASLLEPASVVEAEPAPILVVDDLPEKLLVFETVLEELGQKLVFVRSGAEALRQVLQQEFAVILLDVNMPDIDGFETAALIRKYKRSAFTPIIFITSYADEMQTARGYSLGAVDYILSPVVPEVLRSKVKVFVSLFQMQRQIQRQADARAEMMAAENARRLAEENDRWSAFLAGASRSLSGSLEIAAAVRSLSDLLVPQLASVAGVLLVDPALTCGEAHFSATGPEGSDGALMQWSVDAAMVPDAIRSIMQQAMDERQRVRVSAEQLGLLDAGAFGAPPGFNPARLRRLGAVPLISADRVLGALLIGNEIPPEPPESLKVAVFQDLVERAAAALENARLYRILQGEIQERRAAQDELLNANRRKDEFLAMMSHELRNPLAPIQTALELIRRTAAPAPKLTWAIDVAERQLGQMTRLIEELLDVARISQGKIALKRQSVDLNAVIAQGVETAQPFIDSRRQTLSVVVPKQPAWLQGDFARLTQVVANLLNNAAKYSPEETLIELHSELQDGSLVVSVRDQGMGIDPELMPRIFDLFSQGERGLDRSQGGLGVGLTLARRLVELHGGRIEAFSEGADRGSEFRVTLPCLSMPGEEGGVALPQHGHAEPLRQSERVLVVDDNQDAALSIAAILELEGYHVRTAEDGEQALAMAAEYAPQIVMIDIGLPLIDGYEVARRLRALPQTAQSLLLALTGYGQREDKEAAHDAGFDAHFVKPVNVDEVLARVDEWSTQGRLHAAQARA